MKLLADFEIPVEIMFVMIEATTVGNWFRNIIAGNGEYKEHYLYESMARNYLVFHAQDWTGISPKVIWSELDLGTYHNRGKGKLICDVILQYETEIWIIEVKDRIPLYGIFPNKEYRSAVDQLRIYEKRIKELGWWPNHSVHLAVFWAYNKKDISGKILPIDIEESKEWPRIRNK